jgi:hypothetical protein
MSQFGLFQPDGGPVFESAYRPGARIVLVHEDSLETMKSLPDRVAKPIITSPSYNLCKPVYEPTGRERASQGPMEWLQLAEGEAVE